MEQRKSTSDSQSGAPLAWMHRAPEHAPERRAKMLEHMARARSAPQAKATQAQAATGPGLSRAGGWDILRDAYGYGVLFGIIALIFQSSVPLFAGAFIFLTDGERIESALATIGIRLEPDAIGPQIVKGFVSLFGWFALLVSLRGSVPIWLAAWMPPAEPSWSFIAAVALAFATVETIATFAMRAALPWFGWEIRSDGLTWKMVKLALAIGILALLLLHGPF
ncbi:hypothetical protein JQ621_03175 [Bradyrhizobium manausense]|uniref:hypothetical protein n=1 Tax=Bradyrhizobium manausense TaxID=989370 RepID=UPI001BA58057|nr:hypothetical protein [Bradyrhizobium manausense]MBR1086470.1 hypothetical protein [Bradyrhizobium manausense]